MKNICAIIKISWYAYKDKESHKNIIICFEQDWADDCLRDTNCPDVHRVYCSAGAALNVNQVWGLQWVMELCVCVSTATMYGAG